MGWTQETVVLHGKRQYQKENTKGESNSLLGDTENKSEVEDDMKSHYTKRPRDSSPQRKPLGCKDVTSDMENLTVNTECSREFDEKKFERLSPHPNSILSNTTPTVKSTKYNIELKDYRDRGDGIADLNSVLLPPTRSSRSSSKGFPTVGPTSIRKSKIFHKKALCRNFKNSNSQVDNSGNTKEMTDDGDSEYLTEDGVDESDETDTDTQPSIGSNGDKEGRNSAETDTSDSVDVTTNAPIHTRTIPGVRFSLFPFVPPFINFCQHDEQCTSFPDVRTHLKWRLSTITPIVVRKTVSGSGFRALKQTVEWTGQWGKHMKAVMFRASLKDYQKLNHLPATFNVGRKDKLWRNFQRSQYKFGKENFGYLPKCFVLPQELKNFKSVWDASAKARPWIVKPPAGARGNGIRVINKWGQVPKKRSSILQKYISNPFLINSRKFDIRIYVLVTSFYPLKLYLYRDGLVRFAPVRYSNDSKRVSERNMHLTNYSINKTCDLYTRNDDADAMEGHKWTLKSLWRYLRCEGHDVDALWRSIEDIVIKTMISAEKPITAAAFNLPTRYNGYELFGFDVLLDDNLKPWLLEVNISPSLHSSSTLDLAVKGPLIREVFNIVGYHYPDLMSSVVKKKLMEGIGATVNLETPVFDKRIYSNLLSPEEKMKQNRMKQYFECREKYLDSIVEDLNPDDIRYLIQAEDELSQCHGFTRIFPTCSTYEYFQFFEDPKYYNQLFDAWEWVCKRSREDGIERLRALCQTKLHLQCVPNSQTTSDEGEENDLGMSSSSVNSLEENSEEIADDNHQKPLENISSTEIVPPCLDVHLRTPRSCSLASSEGGNCGQIVLPLPASPSTDAIKSC